LRNKWYNGKTYDIIGLYYSWAIAPIHQLTNDRGARNSGPHNTEA